MRTYISKSVFIAHVEEGYNVDPHFAVYVRENEPYPHNSWCGAFDEYCLAEEYAADIVIELKEEIL